MSSWPLSPWSLNPCHQPLLAVFSSVASVALFFPCSESQAHLFHVAVLPFPHVPVEDWRWR